MQRVAVLGSTGSIGRSTLDVIASHPEELQLVGIASCSQIELLGEQIRQLHPPLVAVWHADKAKELARLSGRSKVGAGQEGLIELATHPSVDAVVIAMSGREGLVPLIRAIEAGKRIALASKELLVMAGELLMRLVREHGTSLVPIDSEHAALFQCLQGVDPEQVERLVITGSGGSLWKLSPQARLQVNREQVLAHPKWRMGPKITVDSSTLMNKGLEVIEAQWLFGMPIERIQIVIHPEAVVHALVELVDGAWLAQLSPCDMRLPIQYALSFPARRRMALPRMRLRELSALHFEEPDVNEFPCLRLALEAANTGGSAPIVLNGANDVAVHAYLDGRLPFADIPTIIADALAQSPPSAPLTVEDILVIDRWARTTAEDHIKQLGSDFVSIVTEEKG